MHTLTHTHTHTNTHAHSANSTSGRAPDECRYVHICNYHPQANSAPSLVTTAMWAVPQAAIAACQRHAGAACRPACQWLRRTAVST